MSTAAATKTSIAILLAVVALLMVSVRPGFAGGGFAQTSGRDVAVKIVDRGPLVPGRASLLRVRITNPYASATVVSSLRAELDSGVAGCTAATDGIAGKVRLGARASRIVTLAVTLAASAPNACQGASFAATFSAAASA